MSQHARRERKANAFCAGGKDSAALQGHALARGIPAGCRSPLAGKLQKRSRVAAYFPQLTSISFHLPVRENFSAGGTG